MTGTIDIQNLSIQCIIGILPNERIQKQELLLNIAVDYDFAKAKNSEHITDAVDYTKIAESVENLLVSQKYQLIETAVEAIAELLFHKWPQLEKCSIQIKKPSAIANADFAAVKIVRKNLSFIQTSI
ncbi:MAG: dihydroneopterin aldolase [Chitinophagales bacterium]